MTSGGILPVRPVPSPEPAGAWPGGGQQRRPEPQGPLPFSAEDTHGIKSDQENGSRHQPDWGLLLGPSRGWAPGWVWRPWVSLDLQTCPLAGPRGRFSLAGLRAAGRCLGRPCGGSADAKVTKRWRYHPPSPAGQDARGLPPVASPSSPGSAPPPIHPTSEFSPASPQDPPLFLLLAANAGAFPARGAPASRSQVREWAEAGVWTVSVYYHVDTDTEGRGQTSHRDAGRSGWHRAPGPGARGTQEELGTT